MSIPHIESLPINKFLDTVKELYKYRATEKLDGANLIFGKNLKGEFYTSREGKNGQRYYSYLQYPDNVACNGFRSSHVALYNIIDYLDDILHDGQAIETEILYGKQPNAIVYGHNYIVFLRQITGDDGINPSADQSELMCQELSIALSSRIVSVQVPVYKTKNGITIIKTKETHDWKFSAVQPIDNSKLQVDTSQLTSSLEAYLEIVSNIGCGESKDLVLTLGDIANANLNSYPIPYRSIIKQERDRINQTISTHHIPIIKKRLLEDIVWNIKPVLQTENVPEGMDIGVEGIVLVHPDTKHQVKIVDKERFTKINEFNFAIRNQIKSYVKRPVIPEADLGIKGNIYSNLYEQVANIFGIPQLSELTRIKHFLKKYLGKTLDDTSKNIAKIICERKDYRSDDLKKILLDQIENSLSEMSAARKKYMECRHQYVLDLPGNRKITYTDEIHYRTLVVFAEVREELANLCMSIQSAATLPSIITILYKKQLETFHDTL